MDTLIVVASTVRNGVDHMQGRQGVLLAQAPVPDLRALDPKAIGADARRFYERLEAAK